MFEQGTIVLVPFPFTDLTSVKTRPAVVISFRERGNDVVIAMISSQHARLHALDLLLESTDANFSETGLRATSLINVARIVTLDKKLIYGKLGKLSSEQVKHVKARLKKLFAL